MLAEYIEKNAVDFDQALNFIKEYEKLSQIDINEFLSELLKMENIDEIKEKVNGLVEKFAIYGYPKYGYPGISIIDELKKVLEAKDIKKAIQDLIDKLAKIKYGYGYPATARADEEQMETVNLLNQEICAVGDFTTRGVKITKEDLEEIAKNYTVLKDKVKPPIKLGHFGEGLGLPSMGWIENVRVEGDKLIADFMHVPKKLADLIRAKAYRRVSPELYVDFEDDGKKHGKVLKAVAILGADIPQIKNLKDLEVLYNSEEIKNLDFVIDEGKKDNKAEKKTLEDSKIERLLRENIELKVDQFIEKNSNKVIPVIKDLVKEVLTTAYMSDIEVNFTEKDKEVKLSLGDAIKEIFERLPDIVDLEERAKSNVYEPNDENKLIENTMKKEGLSRKDAIRKLVSEGKIKVFMEQ